MLAFYSSEYRSVPPVIWQRAIEITSWIKVRIQLTFQWGKSILNYSVSSMLSQEFFIIQEVLGRWLNWLRASLDDMNRAYQALELQIRSPRGKKIGLTIWYTKRETKTKNTGILQWLEMARTCSVLDPSESTTAQSPPLQNPFQLWTSRTEWSKVGDLPLSWKQSLKAIVNK